MTAKWLTVVAEALVLLGFITLWSGWKGSATLTRAFPFHASAAQLTGSATGSYALIGVPKPGDRPCSDAHLAGLDSFRYRAEVMAVEIATARGYSGLEFLILPGWRNWQTRTA